MNKTIYVLVMAIAVFFTANATPNILPKPVNVNQKEGSFILSNNTVISVQNETQKSIATFFITQGLEETGIIPSIVVGDKGNINAGYDSKLNEEEYILDINPESIMILSGSDKGIFYAFQIGRAHV